MNFYLHIAFNAHEFQCARVIEVKHYANYEKKYYF